MFTGHSIFSIAVKRHERIWEDRGKRRVEVKTSRLTVPHQLRERTHVRYVEGSGRGPQRRTINACCSQSKPKATCTLPCCSTKRCKDCALNNSSCAAASSKVGNRSAASCFAGVRGVKALAILTLYWQTKSGRRPVRPGKFRLTARDCPNHRPPLSALATKAIAAPGQNGPPPPDRGPSRKMAPARVPAGSGCPPAVHKDSGSGS